MAKGALALVLHAHLPYVRSAEKNSLEEDWYFQALLECYIPLLDTLQKETSLNHQNPKLTISLSPTLLSLFRDNELNSRFQSWANTRINLLKNVPKELKESASYLSGKIKNQITIWDRYQYDLIKQFRDLQNQGIIDILTCAATHGYLPLLRENPESVRGQLKTAVREHSNLFGINPLGIWLPECAYYEGLDQLLIEAGLRYAILDGHGILHANPRPKYGLYAPICSSKGVAFFGRDSESTLPVWSAKDGYPGDPVYREFHKDLGWEIPMEDLRKIGIKQRRPLGLKLYKVTNQSFPLNKKEPYDYILASKKIKEHASKYIKERKLQLNSLEKIIDNKPLLVAPFDAELFGHWWFEGPEFLAELFKQGNKQEITFTRLIDVLKSTPNLQLCEPSASSWGQGGYHNYWLNESNSWVVIEWNKASEAIIERCNCESSNKKNKRVLNLAAKQLLLAQSSDWSFILRAGTTTELAEERINKHLKRFWMLIKLIDSKDNNEKSIIEEIEKEDLVFPLINYKDWTSI